MLTKSYIDMRDRDNAPLQDRVLYDLFARVRQEGRITQFISLETNKRINSDYILDESNKYAKGLLSLGILKTGEDFSAMIGCYTLEALAVWVGCLSIGVASLNPFIYEPRFETIEKMFVFAKPKIVFIGDGADQSIALALCQHFDKEKTYPTSVTLPFVRKIFYEGRDTDFMKRNPFLTPLADLRNPTVTSVTDTDLLETRRKVKPDHNAHVVFTSGSTGYPKGILHTHKTLLERFKPTFSPTGQVVLVTSLNKACGIAFETSAATLAGMNDKVVLAPASPLNYTESCAAGMVKEGVNCILLLGKKLETLCDYMSQNHPDFGPIREVILTGQCHSTAYKQKLKDYFGGKVLDVYGSTECSTVGISPFKSGKEGNTTQGLIPSSKCEIRLVDDNGDIVDIGEEGSLEVKTPRAFVGYVGMEQTSREAFTNDGFYKTGDTAVMFPNSRFLIKGRSADCLQLKVNTLIVWPSVIENALASIPGIRAIKVISGKESLNGDEIVYCIQYHRGKNMVRFTHLLPKVTINATVYVLWQTGMQEGMIPLTTTTILRYCKENYFNEMQYPRRILFFEEFPETMNQRKTDVRKLQQRAKDLIKTHPDIGMVSEGDEEYY